ncbi:MAG: hypothetical protein EBS06_03795 [Proteobacteria bacterium]|nr:hypothetical protein [Pseudomonadota bacterium]
MLNPDLAAKIFSILYDDIDGYSISHAARRDLENKDDLLYGELPFETWREIVIRADPKKDGVFFDVGSGTGRIVMLSHLLFDFKKTVGVELLEGLYNKACEVKENFNNNIKPEIINHDLNREIEFLHKNIFDVDLSSADFIFMNHPFKDRELFELLEAKFLCELKPKTKIVTTIRSLKDKAFKSFGSKKYNFSWGESTAYFYEV